MCPMSNRRGVARNDRCFAHNRNHNSNKLKPETECRSALVNWDMLGLRWFGCRSDINIVCDRICAMCIQESTDCQPKNSIRSQKFLTFRNKYYHKLSK